LAPGIERLPSGEQMRILMSLPLLHATEVDAPETPSPKVYYWLLWCSFVPLALFPLIAVSGDRPSLESSAVYSLAAACWATAAMIGHQGYRRMRPTLGLIILVLILLFNLGSLVAVAGFVSDFDLISLSYLTGPSIPTAFLVVSVGILAYATAYRLVGAVRWRARDEVVDDLPPSGEFDANSIGIMASVFLGAWTVLSLSVFKFAGERGAYSSALVALKDGNYSAVVLGTLLTIGLVLAAANPSVLWRRMLLSFSIVPISVMFLLGFRGDVVIPFLAYIAVRGMLGARANALKVGLLGMALAAMASAVAVIRNGGLDAISHAGELLAAANPLRLLVESGASIRSLSRSMDVAQAYGLEPTGLLEYVRPFEYWAGRISGSDDLVAEANSDNWYAVLGQLFPNQGGSLIAEGFWAGRIGGAVVVCVILGISAAYLDRLSASSRLRVVFYGVTSAALLGSIRESFRTTVTMMMVGLLACLLVALLPAGRRSKEQRRRQ